MFKSIDCLLWPIECVHIMGISDYIFVSILNGVTFLSLTKIQDSAEIESWILSLLLFCASVAVETVSMWKESQKIKSKIMIVISVIMGIIGFGGMIFAGILQFNMLEINLKGHDPRTILIGAPSDSIISFSQIDITKVVIYCGLATISIPIFAILRIAIIELIRFIYNLQNGFKTK